MLRFVQHVLARMQTVHREEKAVAEMMEVADVGELALRLRRAGNAVAHLEGRAIRKRRAQHLLRVNARAKRPDDAL